MSSGKSQDTIEVRGIQLRKDPARESVHKIVHSLHEMRNGSIATPEAQREFIHRDMNNEIQSLEIAAQTLIDFPEAPWELRVSFARQCWDEARHAQLYADELAVKGGYKGEFPIANHEWGVACMIATLAGRLAVQNRAFEGGSLDVFHKMAAEWRLMGEERAAEITEGICVDEIQHVRFANRWLKQMIKERPRVVIEIANAVAQANRIMRGLAPKEGEFSIDGVELAARNPSFPVNAEDRALADFSPDEVASLLDAQQAKLENEQRQRAEYERAMAAAMAAKPGAGVAAD